LPVILDRVGLQAEHHGVDQAGADALDGEGEHHEQGRWGDGVDHRTGRRLAALLVTAREEILNEFLEAGLRRITQT
jgi:hypothetical protein